MLDPFQIWADAVTQNMVEKEDRAFMELASTYEESVSESDDMVEISTDLGMCGEFDFSKLKEGETVPLGGGWTATQKIGIIWIDGPLIVSLYREKEDAEREALLDHEEGSKDQDLPSRR